VTLTIGQVTSTHYHLSREVWWSQPLSDHTIAIDAIDLVTCRIETVEGISGLGYTYTLSSGGGAVRQLLGDEIAAGLIGRRVDRAEPVWHDIWRTMLRYGRGGIASVALAAADVALWDALAKHADLPLHRYIGTHREEVPVYGSSIDLGYSEQKLLETVEGWLARGFSAVKIKVGRSLDDDLARLAAVRKLIGPDVRLMVDANNGWTLPEASRRIAAMAPFDLSWVEEPLMPDDVHGHAALQAQTSTPIAAGETLFSVADFVRYFDAGAIRYVQADVGRVGGITPWLAVAEHAAARHLPMAPHFLHDLHVHLLCAVPNAAILEYLPLMDALIERPLQVVDGLAGPSLGPGHGIRFNESVLLPHLVSQSVAS